MRRYNLLLPAAALVGLALFFCLLVRLLMLRYERGDIYPAYSTLRADPLGTRAYYEALDSMSPYKVARGFTSLHRELEEKPGTLFYLGLDSYDLMFFSKEEVAQLDAYVRNGGRVVMTFAPQDPGTSSSDDVKKATETKRKAGPAAPPKDETKPDKSPPVQAPEASSDQDSSEPQTQQEKYEREELRREDEADAKDNPDKQDTSPRKYQRSLAALWGFGWDLHKESEEKKPANSSSDTSSPSDPDKDKPEVFAVRASEGSVESNVPWKSALYFVRIEPDWQELYDAKGRPVLIRRTWGKGEIIVATDSYLVSNEALRNSRRPALLGLLTGPPGRLLFDETHLGTQEQEGVMYLAKKFRLEGFLYGMLGVVLLFLWHNSVPLVPPRAASRHARLGGTVSGKDSRSGLVNLLRRNIPAADILKTSFAEWQRNVTPARKHLYAKKTEMESVLSVTDASRADEIIQAYHHLREINTPSRAKGNYAAKS